MSNETVGTMESEVSGRHGAGNGMLKADAQLGTIFGGNLWLVPEQRATRK